MHFKGVDSDGQAFENPEELWQQLDQQPQGRKQAWYDQAVKYWDQQDASVDGVLGGYGHVSDADILESEKFLRKVLGTRLQNTAQEPLCAIDCGAGVGRVTEHLLLHHFAEVDLLEPSAHLLQAARTRLSGPTGPTPWPSHHRAVNFWQLGLEQLEPQPSRYDVVWIQWCLLYLTDEDAISFFHRCQKALKPGGKIIVKENICQDGFVVDKDDSSLSRSNAYMMKLFDQAGMQVLYNVQQRNFPKELYKVRMYALQPRSK